jgi:hypothetical protein
LFLPSFCAFARVMPRRAAKKKGEGAGVRLIDTQLPNCAKKGHHMARRAE